MQLPRKKGAWLSFLDVAIDTVTKAYSQFDEVSIAGMTVLLHPRLWMAVLVIVRCLRNDDRSGSLLLKR
jgi:hypothetical protein